MHTKEKFQEEFGKLKRSIIEVVDELVDGDEDTGSAKVDIKALLEDWAFWHIEGGPSNPNDGVGELDAITISGLADKYHNNP